MVKYGETTVTQWTIEMKLTGNNDAELYATLLHTFQLYKREHVFHGESGGQIPDMVLYYIYQKVHLNPVYVSSLLM